MKRLHLTYPIYAAGLAVVGCVTVGLAAVSCIDPIPAEGDPEYVTETAPQLSEVAYLLSSLPLGVEQLTEVHDAVSSSSENGYDEEYTMAGLFSVPGSGVGDELLSTKSVRSYEKPLSEMITEYLKERQGAGSTAGSAAEAGTRAGDSESGARTAGLGTALSAAGQAGTRAGRPGTRLSGEDEIFVKSAEEYIAALTSSDIQIYWPFSSEWDGKTMPVITFDPEDDTSVNTGYQLSVTKDGEVIADPILVDEKFAEEHPVWVINRNSDEKYLSLEMLRNLGPGTVIGGGEVVVTPGSPSAVKARLGSASDADMVGARDAESADDASDDAGDLRAVESADDGARESCVGESCGAAEEDAPLKTLIIRDFTMKRNYDSWFAGASEFFVKCGAVENFTASTEAELKLYSPSVTDFMIVVKRKQVGVPQAFNAVLVSEWTDQLENCAFMIIEDDGGTTTSWKCEALVRVASKSYGVQLTLPFRTNDDVVWRGSLSHRYFEEYNNVTGHFGDVDLTFEIVTR